MAGEGNNQLSVVGIILVVIGVGLVVWSYQLSGSLSSLVSNAITGSQTGKAMMMSRGGAAAVIAGIFLLLQK